MTEGSDVVHFENPISAEGFSMLPNLVMMNPDLTPGAKITYTYLSHLAWRSHSNETETPLNAMSRDFGVSLNTVRGYIKELTTAGLVTSTQRGLNKPNHYVIHDPQPPSVSGVSETDIPASQDLTVPTRAGSLLGKDVKLRRDLPPTPFSSQPSIPDVWLDDEGQNLPFNALRDICGIDPDSPRCSEVAAALNGRGREPGIRALFWTECVRYVNQNPGYREVLYGETDETFARALARRITIKGQTYLDACEVALTPSALRKYWFEPDALARRAAKKNRGVTGDDIRRMGREDIEVRRAS